MRKIGSIFSNKGRKIGFCFWIQSQTENKEWNANLQSIEHTYTPTVLRPPAHLDPPNIELISLTPHLIEIGVSTLPQGKDEVPPCQQPGLLHLQTLLFHCCPQKWHHQKLQKLPRNQDIWVGVVSSQPSGDRVKNSL